MKPLVVFSVLVSICAASVIPQNIPENNSHYVEGESQYIWMENGQGRLELVDLKKPIDETILQGRNGANNEYWLFTRQNPTSRQILRHNNMDSVRSSNYRANRGTVVISHGWTNTGNSEVNIAVTSAFLAAMDVNVIVLDWSRMAGGRYDDAAAGTVSVGNHMGDFIQWLFQNAGGNWNQLHFVGHSLGAHVVGIAGRRTGGRPARITGLDPAGPLWGGSGSMARHRLTSNAGRYVEAIHTDGRALGIMDRSADADFYPNGGRHVQPGCRYIATTSCSHSRAYEFYASSVRSNSRFVGRRCNDLRQAERNECSGGQLHMGNGVVSKSGSGIYGLRTGSSWPF